MTTSVGKGESLFTPLKWYHKLGYILRRESIPDFYIKWKEREQGVMAPTSLSWGQLNKLAVATGFRSEITTVPVLGPDLEIVGWKGDTKYNSELNSIREESSVERIVKEIYDEYKDLET